MLHLTSFLENDFIKLCWKVVNVVTKLDMGLVGCEFDKMGLDNIASRKPGVRGGHRPNIW